MKKILLLGSPHGNEVLGDGLLRHVQHTRRELLPYITFRIGNPKAKQQNVRYIESDLNRSYNGKTTTYEERRATSLLGYIKRNNFDLVLDLHTTTCQQPPCMIVPSVNNTLGPFLRACHITTVVHMNHPIVQSSLIGVYPYAISIEVNQNELTPVLMNALCDSLRRYIDGEGGHEQKTIYHVTSLLAKNELTETQAATLVNFQRSPFGFYPVLVGENSYKKQTDYLGFKASTRYRSKV